MVAWDFRKIGGTYYLIQIENLKQTIANYESDAVLFARKIANQENEIEDLKAIPELIGIACGAEKAEAILGAIKGRIISSIITDENAALRMLSPS